MDELSETSVDEQRFQVQPPVETPRCMVSNVVDANSTQSPLVRRFCVGTGALLVSSYLLTFCFSPSAVIPLFTTVPGFVFFGAAALLQLSGFFWLIRTPQVNRQLTLFQCAICFVICSLPLLVMLPIGHAIGVILKALGPGS